MIMDGVMDELLPASPAVSGSESYRRLLKERARLAWILSGIVLLLYYAFVCVVAFRPSWLAVQLGATGVTIGFPIAAGMFITFWFLTALYSHRANTRLDTLARLATEEVAQ